jgi:hypothetical protein
MFNAVFLPLLLLVLAAVPAALVAYGIDPAWAQYPHGVELILLSRRLQWPLTALTLLLCVALIGLVISGKRRAWWLIGLAPILTLLGHRFAMNSGNAFLVNANPVFVAADQASFMADDEWVVGLIDQSGAVAFPYASLYPRPLVVRNDQAEPMILMWSPFANCATAFRIDRSIRTNELEVVSMPANALLAYNSRIGQFINGVTGTTPDGRRPAGFGSPIPTIKTTWGRWLAAHPGTTVMAPPQGGEAPRRAVLPYFPMPRDSVNLPPQTTIALIRGPTPVAIADSDLGAGPVNFSEPPIVAVRDPVTGTVTAYDRHIDEDLIPIFSARTFRKFTQATMTDSDSGSAWTAGGRAIDGPSKGKKLQPVEIEDGVYYSVARFWYGNLPLTAPLPPKPAS